MGRVRSQLFHVTRTRSAAGAANVDVNINIVDLTLNVNVDHERRCRGPARLWNQSCRDHLHRRFTCMSTPLANINIIQ